MLSKKKQSELTDAYINIIMDSGELIESILRKAKVKESIINRVTDIMGDLHCDVHEEVERILKTKN